MNTRHTMKLQQRAGRTRFTRALIAALAWIEAGSALPGITSVANISLAMRGWFFVTVGLRLKNRTVGQQLISLG